MLEEETATPLEENLTSSLNETKKSKSKSKNNNNNKKAKNIDLKVTQPSSSLNENVSQAVAATLGASTTASTILAAAGQATKKIASETVKKAAKSKSKHNSHDDESESLFESFFPFDSSITSLLQGLDYIFYFWTLLLVLIVGYLTYYQYKQSKANKANATSQNQEKLTLIEIVVKIVALFVVRPIYFVLRFLYVHLIKNVITTNAGMFETKPNQNLPASFSNDASAYAWLNNCFKWFYFSPETTKTINSNIVETLNSAKTQIGQSLQLSTKQQLKFDDIYFKNVDTLPPKFTNIQTVVNSVENLTLRANVEFPNIDMKVEFKKSKRLLDLKMTSAKAQLLIVLSQNKNHVFSLECSLDQNSDLLMTFEKNQNIEPELMQYFETLIQTAVKQTILNLELNSLNKSTPSFAMPTKSIRTTNKPMAPQINQNFVSPQTAGTVNTATATSPTSAQAPPLNQTSAASSATNSPAKTPYNTYDLPIFTNKQTSPSPAPATAPTTPQSRANIINNLLQNNNNAANLNTNAEFNNNNNIETVNLIESNVQARSYEEEEIQFQPAQLLLKPQQQQSQQQNENAFESEVNNIQALAAAAAAANAKQLRNSVNEKRLLVKLLKATNLTNCDEPYIVVELDYPMQKHITDIHRDMSSINEQFFFDIIANSEELTFSIFDRAKDYGNDLVGEAVIPVNDLCSSLSAKRVIQLHRYGQTKTGSITAEFVFIEPSAQADQNEPRLMRVPAPRVRNSSSPFDQLRSTLSPEKRILYRDDLLMPQQIDQYQQKTNPDQLADSEYPSPRSPLYNENTFNRTMDALYTNPMMQAQQQQEQPQNMHRSRQQQPMTPQPRVINRNYLQTQAHNRAKTLDPRGSNDFVKDEAVAGASNDVPLNTLDKRKRSISRSLKSLLNKSTNKLFGHKREKSYDVANTVEAEPYDTQSVDNNKKVSNSIKKLFDSKKPKNPEVEYNQNAPRPGSSGGPAISISRPDDSMLINNQLHYYPNATNEYYMQPTNNMNMNSQIDNSNNFSNNLTDDTYNTTQPVLLRRSYRLP